MLSLFLIGDTSPAIWKEEQEGEFTEEQTLGASSHAVLTVVPESLQSMPSTCRWASGTQRRPAQTAIVAHLPASRCPLPATQQAAVGASVRVFGNQFPILSRMIYFPVWAYAECMPKRAWVHAHTHTHTPSLSFVRV